jgi:Flp pilus assembly protein TadD
MIVLISLGAVRTFTYLRHWNDRDAFYAYSLEQQPRSIQIHMLVGFCAYEQGKLDEARTVLSRGEKLAPGYWQLWKMSAAVEERAGNWAAAVTDYQRAFNTAQNPAAVVEGLNRAMDMLRKMREERPTQTRPASTTGR